MTNTASLRVLLFAASVLALGGGGTARAQPQPDYDRLLTVPRVVRTVEARYTLQTGSLVREVWARFDAETGFYKAIATQIELTAEGRERAVETGFGYAGDIVWTSFKVPGSKRSFQVTAADAPNAIRDRDVVRGDVGIDLVELAYLPFHLQVMRGRKADAGTCRFTSAHQPGRLGPMTTRVTYAMEEGAKKAELVYEGDFRKGASIFTTEVFVNAERHLNIACGAHRLLDGIWVAYETTYEGYAPRAPDEKTQRCHTRRKVVIREIALNRPFDHADFMPAPTPGDVIVDGVLRKTYTFQPVDLKGLAPPLPEPPALSTCAATSTTLTPATTTTSPSVAASPLQVSAPPAREPPSPTASTPGMTFRAIAVVVVLVVAGCTAILLVVMVKRKRS